MKVNNSTTEKWPKHGCFIDDEKGDKGWKYRFTTAKKTPDQYGHFWKEYFEITKEQADSILLSWNIIYP